MAKEAVRLGTVQETLLLTLYGRARDLGARRPMLADRKSAELVARIDYDFTKFRGASLPLAVLRTAMFDVWVRRFLDEHPEGTVVELGVGLNTRSDRVDNGRARFFDLDLPDAIALRRRFFHDTERFTMLAGSLVDPDWIDQVAAAPGPYFFVSEGVLTYLTEDKARTALRQVATRFPGSLVAFDTGGRAAIDRQDRNPVLEVLSARMHWACDDPSSLAEWGLHLLESRTLADPQPELAPRLPWLYRHGLRLISRVLPPEFGAYRLNLYQAAEADSTH
ncbi:class I SAM-dependent methyltransferase [Actinophytocola sp.]|uniref:class I SAM-dependent methyltransferase n=1 Tax=Actinophytocola sp. TaxID=1872138 RepID=UPI002ED25499